MLLPCEKEIVLRASTDWLSTVLTYPKPKREFPAASAVGNQRRTGRELEPQWKGGTLENIIELFLLIFYLIPKGNIDWELEADWSNCSSP